MPSSGTTDFTLRVDELIRKAWRRVGLTQPTGDDMRQARISLNLLLQELGNRAVLRGLTDLTEFQTVVGQGSYTLPAGTIDVQHVMLRQGTIETPIEPYGQGEFQRLPNKTMQGRPVYYWSDRNSDSVVLHLWPRPIMVYTVSYFRIRRIQDVGSYQNTLDMPVKYLPALTSGLAWTLACEKFAAAPAELNAAMREAERMRRDELRAQYEIEVNRVLDEDRDRASMFILPDMRRR